MLLKSGKETHTIRPAWLYTRHRADSINKTDRQVCPAKRKYPLFLEIIYLIPSPENAPNDFFGQWFSETTTQDHDISRITKGARRAAEAAPMLHAAAKGPVLGPAEGRGGVGYAAGTRSEATNKPYGLFHTGVAWGILWATYHA